MRSTAIVAALAAAAIGLSIALLAPHGIGISQRAKHSTPSASEPPPAGERRADTSRETAASDANDADESAADAMQANARITAAERSETSPSLDESSVAASVTESSLSAQEVHDFWLDGDACDVLGETKAGKARCSRAAVVAELIVSVPKTSADSWAYGMEYELNRRLTELLDAEDLRALKRTAVHCNALGCLVYVEGPSAFPGRFLDLAEQIRSDPDIAELNRQGKWPGAGTWNHGVNRAAMIVMPR